MYVSHGDRHTHTHTQRIDLLLDRNGERESAVIEKGEHDGWFNSSTLDHKQQGQRLLF